MLFSKSIFRKILSGIISVSNSSDSDFAESDWVQTDSKGYQQMAVGGIDLSFFSKWKAYEEKSP